MADFDHGCVGVVGGCSLVEAPVWAVLVWCSTNSLRRRSSWRWFQIRVQGPASRPGMDGGGCRSQHCAEDREVVGVAGEDIIAETNGRDHQVSVDDI